LQRRRENVVMRSITLNLMAQSSVGNKHASHCVLKYRQELIRHYSVWVDLSNTVQPNYISGHALSSLFLASSAKSSRAKCPRAGPSRCGAQCKTYGRGVPLSSDFMTSSCSVNRVTIVVERRYAVQH